MVSHPVSEIHGVKFFGSQASCVSHFQAQHWTKKVVSLIKSFGTLFLYALNKMGLALLRVDRQMDPLTNLQAPDVSKKRLVVCIHGLNSNPTQFKKIFDEMQKKGLSDTSIFIPRVLQKGNAKLDDMVQPIFQNITAWAKTAGEKELVLVGVSNGARISKAVEAALVRSEYNANIRTLKVVSIVGACKGSSLANFAKKTGLSWLMSKNIAEEMPVDSVRNQRLDQEWRDGFSLRPASMREYTFIASPHDWQVTNYTSSLMDVGSNARYAIVPGHGHNSIVNAVAKTVAEIILKPDVVRV